MPYTRERLASLFWPESDHERGRDTLRYTLGTVRAALHEPHEPAHVQVSRDTIAIDAAADCDLDVLTFEEANSAARSLARSTPDGPEDSNPLVAKLKGAMSLWRGEFMDGFSLPDAPGFDEWASVQRERCHRWAELVFEQLALAQVAARDLPEAADTTGRWVALSPLNEAAHRQLMHIHLAAGEPITALQVYEACRGLLLHELAAEPAPETQALAERARAARGSAIRAVPVESVTPPPPGAAETPLVGRADEFIRLVELYHAARQGRSQVAVVRGEAGIGKTRLATELLNWAHGQGADVLRGRAFEAGGRLPYQPLLDALRPRVEHENAPDDLLSDVWLAELSRVLPELRERYPDLPLFASDETTARTRLYEAVARLVQALAERAPVILFVDDVQWADSASLDVLQYASKRWAESSAAVLVMLSLRSESLAETPTLTDWLAGMRRSTSVVDVHLGPLTQGDVRHLLEELSGSDRNARLDTIAGWLFEETAGQPFFVTETLRALVDRGVLARQPTKQGTWIINLARPDGEPTNLQGFLPPGIREVVSARLARLSHDARGLLSAGAVLGQRFTFEQLCRVADLAEIAALAALDEVVRAHLLRESPLEAYAGTYVFSHDKVRDAVYAEVGEARRRVFHRHALETLLGNAPAADLARHALAGHLHEPAVRYSLQAGDDAMRLLAARDAIGHYTRALEIAERFEWHTTLAEVRSRRAQALASLGRWADAKADLERMLAAVGDQEFERRAEVLGGLAEASYWLLDVPNVHVHAVQAIELAEQVGRQDVAMAARLARRSPRRRRFRRCRHQGIRTRC